jgi:hypothetical protein
MPKRKRAISQPPPPLPRALSPPPPASARSQRLTQRNLQRLQAALLPSTTALAPDMATATSRTSSPARSKNNLDARNKLEAYRIKIDRTDGVFPPALAHHLDTVVGRPRDAGAAVSPNAKQLVRMRRHAAAQNERTGINKVAPYLLFVGEADFDDRVRGVPHITVKQDICLNKAFLPPPPDAHVKQTWGPLSSPQPDTCLGYVTRLDAEAAGCVAPFTADEESILHSFSLSQYMHFPFLTAQWKVPNSSENLHTAQNQAARDGAAVVNQLHDLHLAAYGDVPSIAQTCHFSVQSDLQHGGLWVHWREGVDHHMELVFDFSMRDQSQLEQLRTRLHNILEHAVGERLKTIKVALPKLADSQASNRFPTYRSTDDKTTPSESSGTLSRPFLNDVFTFAPPLTPSSGPSEPDIPRKRTKYS